jgi:Homeodomain-like domain
MARLDKREEMILTKRRMEIARMYLQGRSQVEIAEKLNVTPPVVYKDLAIIRDEWVDRAMMDFDHRKAEELARLDRLEAVSWQAWERSCEDTTAQRRRQEYIRERIEGKGRRKGHRMIPIAKTEEDTTKKSAGDPRFLERVGWCIETRLRVLGMFKGDTFNQQVMNIDFGSLIGRSDEPDEIEHKIAEVKNIDAITTTPKHLELNGDLTPEQQVELRLNSPDRQESR